ncbi:MAG: hypothetical protein E6K53_14710 [Gammaproteobacteria bacterium]|nr:MAG: hypothetical protein E6K53_14710 [Gammaproteobacteria bacterium]
MVLKTKKQAGEESGLLAIGLSRGAWRKSAENPSVEHKERPVPHFDFNALKLIAANFPAI